MAPKGGHHLVTIVRHQRKTGLTQQGTVLGFQCRETFGMMCNENDAVTVRPGISCMNQLVHGVSLIVAILMPVMHHIHQQSTAREVVMYCSEHHRCRRQRMLQQIKYTVCDLSHHLTCIACGAWPHSDQAAYGKAEPFEQLCSSSRDGGSRTPPIAKDRQSANNMLVRQIPEIAPTHGRGNQCWLRLQDNGMRRRRRRGRRHLPSRTYSILAGAVSPSSASTSSEKRGCDNPRIDGNSSSQRSWGT